MNKEISIKPGETKPKLKVRAAPSGWMFIFDLRGYFHGINIYRKRPGAKKFSYLATDTCSPYIDTDPMVLSTQYYACYIRDGKETGRRSNIALLPKKLPVPSIEPDEFPN